MLACVDPKIEPFGVARSLSLSPLCVSLTLNMSQYVIVHRMNGIYYFGTSDFCVGCDHFDYCLVCLSHRNRFILVSRDV